MEKLLSIIVGLIIMACCAIVIILSFIVDEIRNQDRRK